MFDIAILGCGYLGKAVAKSAINEGLAVAGSSTSEAGCKKLEELSLQPVELRLNNEEAAEGEALSRLLDTRNLLISFPPPRLNDHYSDYLAALGALTMAVNKSNIGQVIFISSTGIYPSINREVDEFTDLDKLQGKSAMLRDAEQILKQELKKPLVIMRLAGLVGPKRHPGRFLAGREGLDGAMVPVNLVHVGDCVAAIRLVFDKAPLEAVYNVVADEHPNREAFYTQAANSLGLPPPTFSDTGMKKWKLVSNILIRTQLGFEFSFPILPKPTPNGI